MHSGNAKCKVSSQQLANARRAIGQQVGSQILGADGVGLRFLQSLPLVVSANRHGKSKADNQCQKRQCGSLNGIKIVSLALFEGVRALPKEVASIRTHQLCDQRDREDDEGTMKMRRHLTIGRDRAELTG